MQAYYQKALVGMLPELDTSLDAVILGMHAKPDNPELLKAQELGLKNLFVPRILYTNNLKTRLG